MRLLLSLGMFALIGVAASQATAQERYRERPPVMVRPEVAAPWIEQLQRAPVGYAVRPYVERRVVTVAPPPRKVIVRQTVEVAPVAVRKPHVVKRSVSREIAPHFLPQTVTYDGPYTPGTIVIDTRTKFLLHIEQGGQARRYGVGVGKEGFGWRGTEVVSNKREWPSWTPPAQMRAREKARGRILPVRMEGGENNPLGARALYLGSTLYRIHGTNQPWTIGTNVSSGCFRMRNEDVIELYDRVTIGSKVVVL